MSWLHWKQAFGQDGQSLLNFTRRLIALRDSYPLLRRRNFMHGKEKLTEEFTDIAWFDQNGAPMSSEAWNNSGERVIVVRRAEFTNSDRIGLLTLLLNPTSESMVFRLPLPQAPTRILIDSSDPNIEEHDIDGDQVKVAPQTAVLVRAIHTPKDTR